MQSSTTSSPGQGTPPDLNPPPTSTDSTSATPPRSSRPNMSRSVSIAGQLKDVWDGYTGGGESGDRPDWMGSFTLLDVLETFFDSRIDLMERRFKVHSDRIKLRAGEVLSKSSANIRALAPKSPRIWPMDRETPEFVASLDVVDDPPVNSGDKDASGVPKGNKERRVIAEKELKRFKTKVSARLTTLSASWESARTLRTRDTVSFFVGVMLVLTSALMFGLCPEWIPIWYTVQSAFYLPTRIWSYKKKRWHYFLWDMCYYVNLLDLVWMWFFPKNTVFFTACYLLTMGPLASAIITWRNSLVFHSLDKVTSLFIHIYPPFTFTVILHFYPGREKRWPAINRMNEINWFQSIILGVGFYVVWQAMYWRFVIVGRREKIAAGLRPTSFQHLLHDKHNVIGKWMRAVKPEKREALFMFWQLVYTIVCFLPAIFVLRYSSFWSGAFLLLVFSVSAWNGGSYYVQVWGRKFERELEALRKEMAVFANTPMTGSSPSPVIPTTASPSSQHNRSLSTGSGAAPHSPLSEMATGPSIDGLAGSPLVLGASRTSDGGEEELEGFSLDVDARGGEGDEGLVMRKKKSAVVMGEAAKVVKVPTQDSTEEIGGALDGEVVELKAEEGKEKTD